MNRILASSSRGGANLPSMPPLGKEARSRRRWLIRMVGRCVLMEGRRARRITGGKALVGRLVHPVELGDGRLRLGVVSLLHCLLGLLRNAATIFRLTDRSTIFVRC